MRTAFTRTECEGAKVCFTKNAPGQEPGAFFVFAFRRTAGSYSGDRYPSFREVTAPALARSAAPVAPRLRRLGIALGRMRKLNFVRNAS